MLCSTNEALRMAIKKFTDPWIRSLKKAAPGMRDLWSGKAETGLSLMVNGKGRVIFLLFTRGRSSAEWKSLRSKRLGKRPGSGRRRSQTASIQRNRLLRKTVRKGWMMRVGLSLSSRSMSSS